MLNEAIVSWRQKEEEEEKKKKKTRAVALLSAPTLRNILQHDEVHPGTPPPKELRQDPPDEDKLPRSRLSALISQTPLRCIVGKKKTKKHPSFEEHDAREMARAVLLKHLFSGEIHSNIHVR